MEINALSLFTTWLRGGYHQVLQLLHHGHHVHVVLMVGSVEMLPFIGTRHVYSASSRYILAYIGLSPETSATGLPGNYYNMFPVLFFWGETKTGCHQKQQSRSEFEGVI